MIVSSDEAYSDWLVWRYPALRGRIAFDVRFELLGSKGITNVARFKEVAGLNWNRPFAGYRLGVVHRAGSPRLAYALLAERGRRVLSRGTRTSTRSSARARRAENRFSGGVVPGLDLDVLGLRIGHDVQRQRAQVVAVDEQLERVVPGGRSGRRASAG